MTDPSSSLRTVLTNCSPNVPNLKPLREKHFTTPLWEWWPSSPSRAKTPCQAPSSYSKLAKKTLTFHRAQFRALDTTHPSAQKSEPSRKAPAKFWPGNRIQNFQLTNFFLFWTLKGKQYFFTVNRRGLKQYSMGNQNLLHDWSLVVYPQNFSENMSAVNISSDESLLFVCSPDCDLELYCIETKGVVDSYQGFGSETEPFGIISTQNVRFLFIYTKSGYLVRIFEISHHVETICDQ